ncbi:MAG: aminoacyl-tRNA hydrolase [Desulfofustis sp.]|nr:aminoacyl-tRNA hydrolase [Desulfofustis sp.]
MTEEDFAIIGLGNPGRNYQVTRHNIGFLFVDFLARRVHQDFQASKWEALILRSTICGRRTFLVKPQTFMNLSGLSVAAFTRFYSIPTNHLIVVHDDIDMAPGRVKLVDGGGSGGHNGIKSIVQHLGTADFLRLKIGIGRPGTATAHPDMPVDAYVLAPLSSEEIRLMEERFHQIEAGLDPLLSGDLAQARTILNSIK